MDGMVSACLSQFADDCMKKFGDIEGMDVLKNVERRT